MFPWNWCAFVTIGNAWLAGQFWTNFMPLARYSRSADFNGTADFTELETIFVDGVWAPTNKLGLGLEYIEGGPKTSSGKSFDANPVGASIALSF